MGCATAGMVLALVVAASAGIAQTKSPQAGAGLPDLPADQIAKAEPGVVPPKPIHAPNAPYTESGRRAEYNGKALVEFVVDIAGKVRNLSVVKDLPYGLGIAARDAISTWKFAPATRNGKPVAYRGSAEMEFRLLPDPSQAAYVPKAQRLENALADVQESTDLVRKRGIAQLEQLAADRYPSAMFYLGKALADGIGLAKDEVRGKRLIANAAEDLEPNALAEQWIQVFALATNDAERTQAVRMVERMQAIGSGHAEAWLASQLWAGEFVPQDIAEARQRLQACTIRGELFCLRTWFLLEMDQLAAEEEARAKLAPSQRPPLFNPCPDLTSSYAEAANRGNKVAKQLEPRVRHHCAGLSERLSASTGERSGFR
ncbi:MAG: energy transducer TonB [Bryobacterales bacterium]|nr:energy transducer TonB [Bryobacterales bacterium]